MGEYGQDPEVLLRQLEYLAALARELMEEGNVELTATPVLLLSPASPPIVRAASREVLARLLGAFAMNDVVMNEAANRQPPRMRTLSGNNQVTSSATSGSALNAESCS